MTGRSVNKYVVEVDVVRAGARGAGARGTGGRSKSEARPKAPGSGPNKAAKRPDPGRNATARPSQPAAAPARRGRPRSLPAEDRRKAILAAALAVFSEGGFAQARLDDVARKAGIAKGTVYLYFPTKEALFEALIRSAVSPVLSSLEALARVPDVPFAALLERLFGLFRAEILGTERRLVLRLLLSEGARFPEVAAFYHREVLSKGVGLLRQVARRAAERGELPSDAVARFPHLVMAPLLLSILWDGLFGRFEPLDVEGLLAAHRDVLTAKPGRRP